MIVIQQTVDYSITDTSDIDITALFFIDNLVLIVCMSVVIGI